MSPLYGWEGPGKTRELELDRTRVPEVEEPAGPRLPGGPEDKSVTLIQCNAPDCGRKFRKAMIAARHFNTTHAELYKDTNTWKLYTKEIVEG